jgi:hypothetical protein
MTVSLVLTLASVAFLSLLGTVEGYAVWKRQPTISNRLQRLASKNVQLAVFAGLVVGWLVAHFTGYAG